jgi:hypothetical protein
MSKKMLIGMLVVVLANVASAALTYNWNFDDGTAMGWAPIGNTSPSTCQVEWIGMLPPPNQAFSNFGLGMNNNGASNHLKWEIQKEITPGQSYTLSFDYKSMGEGTFFAVYAFDAAWNYLGLQQIYDYTAWGWAPSLNVNDPLWTTKSAALNTYGGTAKFVALQLNSLPQWGLTLFDNVTLVPEPATLSILGLGALAMLRRKRS